MKRTQRGLTLVWTMILGLVLVVAGCTVAEPGRVASADVISVLSGEVDEGYARAYKPRPFTFPLDHGPHPEYRTEWWYYVGNLVDDDGNRYGYQLTIFRTALTPELPARASDLASNQVYMGHFALTDGAAGEHVSFERFSRGAGGLAGAQGEPEFAVWLEDWSAEQVAPETMRVQVADETAGGAPVAINLTLRQTRPPVLQGDAGLSQKGPEPGNASYYYSLVGLETAGTISLGARTLEVTGVSWMDREWGTSAVAEDAVGWDWFSLQFDDGTVLMLYQFRTRSGGIGAEFEGTLVSPDGTQTSIAAEDFTLTVLDEWTSPETGITYPSGWRVVLPGFDLDLEILPLIQDQEMLVSFLYWEGAVTVSGTAEGEPVQGVGYVELTGYGSPQPGDFQR